MFTLTLLSFSCSNDSEIDKLEVTDLIIGEWILISENDYDCKTDEVIYERLSQNEQIDVYHADGT
ncbi:MAG: hypothetical protein ABJN95_10165 [Maribacter sp.]|uniref:hypothetical protein n=1 Tax=Maribacter sp. TaxID=1897614 RepID=UPI0032975B47